MLQTVSNNASLCLFCIFIGATQACPLFLNVTFAAVWNAEGRVTFPASSKDTVLIDDTPCLDGSHRMPLCCHIHDLQPTPVSCVSAVKFIKCSQPTLSFLRCHTLFPLLFSFFWDVCHFKKIISWSDFWDSIWSWHRSVTVTALLCVFHAKASKKQCDRIWFSVPLCHWVQDQATQFSIHVYMQNTCKQKPEIHINVHMWGWHKLSCNMAKRSLPFTVRAVLYAPANVILNASDKRQLGWEFRNTNSQKKQIWPTLAKP